MLDTPISYNGYELNTLLPLSGGIRAGCIVEEFDFGRVAGVGYTEKRAQDDGLDVSDVYLGSRVIQLSGTVYGSSGPDLFDRLQSLRMALTPTVAYTNGQPDRGYIPLQFQLPTLDPEFGYVSGGSGGTKLLEYRCRPVSQPQFSLRRDSGAFRNANNDPAGGAVSWRATLECADPRMYVRPEVQIPIVVGTNQSIVNRGDYPAPLDVILAITSSTDPTAHIEIFVGGSQMNIVIGVVSNAVFRYSSALKVLTVTVGGVEALRMDALVFYYNTTHPMVSPLSGQKFSIGMGGTPWPTIGAGSRLQFSESFA